jgi:TnpA family transposase
LDRLRQRGNEHNSDCQATGEFGNFSRVNLRLLKGESTVPSVQDTAYPRLKANLSEKELNSVYTPTEDELSFAKRMTRGRVANLSFLILLKVFQRLGYSVYISAVPAAIIRHIVSVSHLSASSQELLNHDHSKTHKRHVQVIREHLNLHPYDTNAQQTVQAAMEFAALSKHDLVDLINIAIEELVRQRYELPGFSTLERLAQSTRAAANKRLFDQFSQSLSVDEKAQIEALFEVDAETQTSAWNRLKQDPGKPSVTHLVGLVNQLEWLKPLQLGTALLNHWPDAKLKHFAEEALQLDASRMKQLERHKRHTLAAILLKRQYAQTLDDLSEMFIRQIQQLHQKGKEALVAYRMESQSTTDGLITTLRDLMLAFKREGSTTEKFEAIAQVIGDRAQTIVEQCEALLNYTGHNYYSFLQDFYKGQRAGLFRLLEGLPIYSSTQEQSFMASIQFLRTHRDTRSPQLSTVLEQADENQPAKLLDLDWIPQNWWHLVTGQRSRATYPTEIHRRHFEVCVFSQIMWELKSGDLYVDGSDEFADYYGQLLDWQTCQKSLKAYSLQVNLPTETSALIQHTQQWLSHIAQETDQRFPENVDVDFQKDRLVIHKAKKKELKGLTELTELIKQRIKPVHLLDTLIDTELWLNWTRFFKPKSGHEAKLEQPVARYLASAFCYGCNLGSSQAARSLEDFDRRQVAYINQRHIDEAKLQAANTAIINAYNRFRLPKYWGDGRRAAVDGTKWDIYENNLLAEYHIRYGGYGGIAYYHVSDTYIALFSHFIPCGVWEAIHLLDGLLNNTSDIQPDIVHGDTQAQSATVFALAYLLGIQLMPRIRNWKDLSLYRPKRSAKYKNIDRLFSEIVNWELIETYLPDMLRVALSVKEGRIRAATILRKLGSSSSKNRLYQAFHELGCAVRSGFLLQYINDAELRTTIQATTNKSEAFNGFAKWLSFGGNILSTNNREEQRKLIRYNHLVANSLIFHNVFQLSQILEQLVNEGYTIEPEAVAALSPYWTHHVNRFGAYQLDLTRQPPTIDYDATVVSANLLTLTKD